MDAVSLTFSRLAIGRIPNDNRKLRSCRSTASFQVAASRVESWNFVGGGRFLTPCSTSTAAATASQPMTVVRAGLVELPISSQKLKLQLRLSKHVNQRHTRCEPICIPTRSRQYSPILRRKRIASDIQEPYLLTLSGDKAVSMAYNPYGGGECLRRAVL